MGHGARTDLAGLDALLEILHRNIGPHVAAEVDENGVDAFERVEQRRQIVVMLDLGGVLRAGQPQCIPDETVGERDPVDGGVGDVVGVEIARRAAEFGRDGDGFQLVDLPVEPFDEDHQLLAQPRGRGGLAVRVGQHRDGVPLGGQRGELLAQFGQCRVADLRQRLLDRERNGRVVDVLRREAEVDELLAGAQPQRIHLLFEQVLDGFHVVVGRALDLLDALGVGRREVAVKSAQSLECGRADPFQFGQRQFAQGDEILHFDADAVADQGVFRKVVGQSLRYLAVASVDGRNGGQVAQ